MQSQGRIFDDLAKLLNGAAGTFAGMGREAESNFRERAREWMAGLDFVSREEFEAVKAMAAAARDDVAALKAQLAAGGTAAAAKAKPAAKAAPAAKTKSAAKAKAPAKPATKPASARRKPGAK